MIDERSYQIMILNLLNRAVDIELGKSKSVKMENVEKTVEDLKDLVRKQYGMFKK